MQSVTITINVVSLNHTEAGYNIMTVIKFVSDLQQVGCFLNTTIPLTPRIYSTSIIAYDA